MIWHMSDTYRRVKFSGLTLEAILFKIKASAYNISEIEKKYF